MSRTKGGDERPLRFRSTDWVVGVRRARRRIVIVVKGFDDTVRDGSQTDDYAGFCETGETGPPASDGRIRRRHLVRRLSIRFDQLDVAKNRCARRDPNRRPRWLPRTGTMRRTPRQA